MPNRHRVLILGGGFGGLYAAQALKHAPVDVTLVDRRNYHLFQPLLYQVATGSLSPGEIAAPIRGVLNRQKNTQVLLGEAVSIDPALKRVTLRDGGELDVRFADRRDRVAEQLFRQRRVAKMGTQPEEYRRGDSDSPQDTLRFRSGGAAARKHGRTPRMADVRDRRGGSDGRGACRRARRHCK